MLPVGSIGGRPIQEEKWLCNERGVVKRRFVTGCIPRGVHMSLRADRGPTAAGGVRGNSLTGYV